jgi:hypothetical protein
VVEVVFLDTAGMREIVEGDGDEDQVFEGMMRVLYPQHIATDSAFKITLPPRSTTRGELNSSCH